MLKWTLCVHVKYRVMSVVKVVVTCSNAFEDPELGFSHQQQSEATPLSHPSPYDTRHKTAALELQDRPQK